MSDKPAIRSFMVPPPGRLMFCEVAGRRYEDTYWPRLRKVVYEALREANDPRTPEECASDTMCPYMPGWYCSGLPERKVVRMREAKDKAKQLFAKPVVTFDEISRRLRVCADCPRHDRSLCLTCTGMLRWINDGFGGRRTAVPEDRLSGTCTCCGTFTAAAAAVDYGDEPSDWEDVPDTCWRLKHA